MENIIIKFANDGTLADQSLVNQPAPYTVPLNLLQHIPLPIFSLSLGCTILDINQTAADLYGWERSKVLGKSFLELCIGQGIAIPPLPNLTQLKQNQSHITDYMPTACVNKTHNLAWHILRYTNEQQKMDGFLFIGQPAVEQNAASATALDQHTGEQIREETQREVLTQVSHELLPTLQAIVTATRSLTVGETEPGRISLINDIAQYSNTIVCQLENLDCIAKLGVEPLTPREEPCDLRNIMEEVARVFSMSCQQKGIKIITSYPLSVMRHILSDRHGLRLILRNLISNAFRFTERGTLFVAVTCKEQVDDEVKLDIKVQDTGKGISKETIAQLLSSQELATQNHFAQNNLALQGFGLRVVKSWIDALKGSIRIESQPGNGTTVVCMIPFKLAAAQQDLSWQPPCKNLKVLVIDDCQLRGDVILQHFSNHVGSTRLNGEEAMVRFVAKETVDPPYQIVIVDDETAGVTPLALARQVRAHPELNHCMLVLCTRSSTKLLDEARANGYTVILQKPVQPSDLINIIQNEWAKWHSNNIARREERKNSTLSVLLVEDNQLAQKISKSMLEDLGCKVAIAGTGEEALRAMENHYDAIFMDVGLPDCDGLEVTRRIRRMHYEKSTVPIIAMTAHVSEHDKRLCFESGMDDFISKPISYESLQKVLQRCVLKTAV